jgi:hypothetical protein
MESSTYLASRLYRLNERYIKVSATTHWRDAPACCEVHLGEGSETWPESDWNAIALWQLGCESTPPPRTDPFRLRDVADLPRVLRRVCAALLRDGKDFLAGDLRRFRKARAASAARRQPYMIGEIGRDGRYVAHAEPESAALRARFASESELASDSIPPPRKRRKGG